MANRSRAIKQIVNTSVLGVSFSARLCQEMGINWREAMKLLAASGIGRFRLMSYWDSYEKVHGERDFKQLDAEMDLAEKLGCQITLCLGMRQPRWPETHIPDWARKLSESEQTSAYQSYQAEVINRYKSRQNLQSWQLENEFWNRGFGIGNVYGRPRLKAEMSQIRLLDPERPVIMSLANTYGLPIFGPKPDIFGTTIYQVQYQKARYKKTVYPSWYFRLRRLLVRLIGRRDLLIHELQAEPWGPEANSKMSDTEQAKSMDAAKLAESINYARSTGMKYMDLWGGEWWVWRKLVRSDSSLLSTISKLS